MNPRVAIRITIDGEPRTLDFRQAVAVAAELVKAAAEAEQVALSTNVRLGAFLMQVRNALPHGTWTSWVAETGMNLKTAGNRMRVAARFGDAHGHLRMDEITAAANAWNELYASQPKLHVDVQKLRTIDLEKLSGARTPADGRGQTQPEKLWNARTDLGRGETGNATRATRAGADEAGTYGDGPTLDELLASAPDEVDEDGEDGEREAGGLGRASMDSRSFESAAPLLGGNVQGARPVLAPGAQIKPLTGKQTLLTAMYEAAERVGARVKRLLGMGGSKARETAEIVERFDRELEQLEGGR